MDNVRILKGYSKEEQRELEEAKDNGFNSAFDVIYGIIKSEGDLGFIVKKYDEDSSSDNDQLAKDIVDYYAGVAKFAEQKYVVHDTTDHYIYYDELLDNLRWSQPLRMPEKKTKDEWLAINPAYEPMLERVEDDEWQRSNVKRNNHG